MVAQVIASEGSPAMLLAVRRIMTTRRIALALVCFVFAGHGQPLHPSTWQSTINLLAEGGTRFKALRSPQSRGLATLLLALNSAAAFNPNGLGEQSHLRAAAIPRVPVVVTDEQSRLGCPAFSRRPLSENVVMGQRVEDRGNLKGAAMEEPDASAFSKASSQLDDVLGSLPAGEKYNAVLLSMLSRGGDVRSVSELIDEMTSKRIKLSEESLNSLINNAVTGGSLPEIQRSLSAARKNGMCRTFATPQLQLPVSSASALESLPSVPKDRRRKEKAAAYAFTLALGALLGAEFLDSIDFLLPTDVDAPPLPLVFGIGAAGWAADRYAARGQVFGLIGKGLSRIFLSDLQRECAVESASLLLGYVLGLPCCASAPNVARPLDMLAKISDDMTKGLESPARLVDRILVWLMAPAALENMLYDEMRMSEPSLAKKFLAAVRRQEAVLGVDVQQGGWLPDTDANRLKWAYSQARSLLQKYSAVREELQDSMAAGISAGECVNLIERRLSR